MLWEETEHVAECEKWTQFSCTELMEIELSRTRQAKRSSDLQHPPPPLTTNFSATRMQEGKLFANSVLLLFCIFLVWNSNMNTKFFVLSYFESCFLEFCDI